MFTTWLAYEVTFVKMQYNKIPIGSIAKALGKSDDDVVSKAIELGLESVKNDIGGIEYNFKRKSKYELLRYILEVELNDRMYKNTSVVINEKEIAIIWGIPLRQTRVHLSKMFVDKKFTFICKKKDILYNYFFCLKHENDTPTNPAIQDELIIDNTEYINSLPQIATVKWNKKTDKIVEYILNKINASSDSKPVKVNQQELVKELGFSLSAVKSHIDVIKKSKDCNVVVIDKTHGKYTCNYYTKKGAQYEMPYGKKYDRNKARKMRKELGLCTQCGNKLDREGSFCVKCNKMRLVRKKEIRVKLLSEGKCVMCGSPHDRHTLLCDKCRQKQVALARKRADYRRENGLCTICGNKVENGVLCSKCNEKRKIQRQKREMENKVNNE
jgi:hypothetical protein